MTGNEDRAFMSPRQASSEPEHPSSPAHSTNSWEFLREDDFQEAEPEDGESGRSMVEVSPCISSLATDGAASEQASDSDSHFTNELIAAGEPEECPVTPMLSQGASPAASEAGADPEIQPVQPIPSVEPVPSAYPAPLLTRVCMAAASELVTLTRQVSSMLAALGSMGEDCARGAWASLAGLVAGLRAGLGVGMWASLPRGLGAAPLLAGDLPGHVVRSAQGVAARLRKRGAAAAAAAPEWPALVAAAGCAAACVALHRSAAANARLSARLAQREGELAELVSRIMALQRTLTRHHAVRAVPIIAHASCSWHGVATAGASL
ncbi:hypothetical protein ACKKBG_A33515 [Auxenochlorella protothecoides x Auxenochlorella symbiontica]